MIDVPEDKTVQRNQAELIIKMTKAAQALEKDIGAMASVVICFFEENGQVRVQDAGRFPMPPDDFYQIMLDLHKQGQLGQPNAPKKTVLHNMKRSKILKPH